MRVFKLFEPLRDRGGDEAGLTRELGKPPVLRRGTLRLLSVACLVMVIYGTLGPLGVHGRPWLVPAEHWRWVPDRQPSNLDDVLTNFVVYLPVGVAFRLLVRRRGSAGPPDLVIGLCLSVALSYVTEILQQFMPARSSSLADVHVNGVAALVGGLLAPAVQDAIRVVHAVVFRRWRTHSWAVLAWAATAVTVGLMTVPWDFCAPSAELRLWRPLDLVDVRRFGMFVVLGFCTMAARVQRRGYRPAVVRDALLRACLIGLILELAQLFLVSHECGFVDFVVTALGALAGGGSVLSLIEMGFVRTCTREPGGTTAARFLHGTGPLRRALALIALLLTVACVIVFSSVHGGPADPAVAEPAVRWMPFQAHFLKPFHRVMTDVAEAFALYGFLTALCLSLTGGRGRAAALMLALGLVASIEAYQALTGRGVADTTPMLLAALAWFVAVRVWTALRAPTRTELGAGRAAVP